MAFDDTDRRRFLLAAIVSLLTLPVLWWANRDDPSSGPTTASVGVEVGGTVDGEAIGSPDTAATVDSTISRSNLPSEPTVLDKPPIFLDGPPSAVGGVSQIAIPNPDALQTIITRATFGDVAGTEACLAHNIPAGELITVINLDNNRVVTCRVTRAPESQDVDLILQTEQFETFADLLDAPIPVQIRL